MLVISRWALGRALRSLKTCGSEKVVELCKTRMEVFSAVHPLLLEQVLFFTGRKKAGV